MAKKKRVLVPPALLLPPILHPSQAVFWDFFPPLLPLTLTTATGCKRLGEGSQRESLCDLPRILSPTLHRTIQGSEPIRSAPGCTKRQPRWQYPRPPDTTQRSHPHLWRCRWIIKVNLFLNYLRVMKETCYRNSSKIQYTGMSLEWHQDKSKIADEKEQL